MTHRGLSVWGTKYGPAATLSPGAQKYQARTDSHWQSAKVWTQSMEEVFFGLFSFLFTTWRPLETSLASRKREGCHKMPFMIILVHPGILPVRRGGREDVGLAGGRGGGGGLQEDGGVRGGGGESPHWVLELDPAW